MTRTPAAGGGPPGEARPAVVLRRLIGLSGVRPARLALPVGLGALAVTAGAALTGLAGYLICRAAQRPPLLSLTVILVAVRALALLRPAARYAERLTSHDLAFRSLGHLRTGIFARLEPLAPAGLEAYRDGELLSRMVADVDDLQDVALRLLLPPGVALVAGVVVVTGVAVASPLAGAVLTAGLGCAATLPPLVAARVAARARRRQAALRARLTADLVDAFGAAEELWLNGADGRAAAAIAADDRALVRAALRDARAAGVADALTVAVGGLTALGVLVAATAAAGRGALDPLLVAPLALVAAGAFEAVVPLAASARHLPSVLSTGRRVLELVDREPEVADPDEPVAVPRRPGITLREVVVVRGPDRRRVLDGVDLTLGPGGRMVVSGPSGAGKTTLAHLLVRFLERHAGTARLGPHDLRDLRQDDVRAAVLLAAQEPHVFDSTIRENVALARPGASDAEVRQALARARLGGWVASLPAGLDTRVGERGRALSGGERQRLALARAFLADPAVLLLDEPDAHLDAATAGALLEDLWREAGERSVLLVTHGGAGPFDRCRRLVLPTSSHRGDATRAEIGLHAR
ncbi:MAG TPA: thiol reductant ABC exporter subunit CydC [Actinomycetes bacterium]|nr:thiol reductant ABC exporter subunit CydC [Actinomycetes bacterium]